MNLNPSYKVVDRTWNNGAQALEVRINPGVRGMPWFVIKAFDGKIVQSSIEGFPTVKDAKQFAAYNKLISCGLHEWLAISYIVWSFENPLDLVKWLKTGGVVVGQNVYTFTERKLKAWEKPLVVGE